MYEGEKDPTHPNLPNEYEHCQLCLKFSDLVKSHLMPKSAYKNVSKLETNPYTSRYIVHGEGDRIAPTSLHITRRALCAECEDKFSKNGEKHVALNGFRETGFALDDQLSKQGLRHILADPNSVGDRTENVFHPIKPPHFYYFALSMVWRTFAIEWRPFTVPYSPKLAPNSLNNLRLFLLHQKTNKKIAKVMVGTIADFDSYPHISFVSQNAITEEFHFIVFGIRFRVWLSPFCSSPTMPRPGKVLFYRTSLNGNNTR